MGKSVGGEHLEQLQRPEAEYKGHFRSKKVALWLVSHEHGREKQISAVMEFRLGGHVEDTLRTLLFPMRELEATE